MKKIQKNILLVIEFIAILLSLWAIISYDTLTKELFPAFRYLEFKHDFLIRFVIFPAVVIVVGVIALLFRRKFEKNNEKVFFVFTRAIHLPMVCYITGLGTYLINTVAWANFYKDGTGNGPMTVVLAAVILGCAIILYGFLAKPLTKKGEKKGFRALLEVVLVLALCGLVFMGFMNQPYLNYSEIDKIWPATLLFEVIIIALFFIAYFAVFAHGLALAYDELNAPAEEPKEEPKAEEKPEEEKEPEMKAVVDFKGFYAAKDKDFGPEQEQPESAPKEVSADDEELFAMHKFAKEALEAKGYELKEVVEKEVIVEKPVEVEKIVEVEKVVEKEPEKPAEPEPAPVVEPKKEEKPKAPKVKKDVLPSPNALRKYIQTHYTDCNIVADEDGESFKAYRNKKMFLNLKVTNNDYRIVFQRKPISITRLLVKYPTISKATSPAGDQWFKLVNKGEFEEEDLQNIIKFSYNYLVDLEEKAAAQKEKEKAKAAEKRKKEREKAKAAAKK